MPNVKHKKVSGKPASTDPALIDGPAWDDEHAVDQYMDLPALGATPAVPPASPGDLRFFARKRANRRLPWFIGPSGLDSPIQPALFGNALTMWLPGTGTTAALSFGVNWTVAATQAHPAIATTNLHTQMRRATFSTSTTAGNAAGVRAAAACCWRGNAAGLGGFYFFARFGFTTVISGMQFLVGLSAQSGALAGEPSAINNTIAIGKDAADTNMQLIFRDGTATTKVNLGAAPAVDQVYDVHLFCPPNGSTIGARVTRLNDNAVLADDTSHTANIVQNAALLFPRAEVRNGTTAAVAAISLARIYLETDT